MHYLNIKDEAQNEEYSKLKYNIKALKSQFISMVPLTVEISLKKLKETYTCVNLYVNYEFQNFNQDDNFYFKYFSRIPTPDDERYKTIKKYACKFDDSDKTEHFCTERYNCLNFELSARNPKNVEAIEEVVALYDKNQDKINLFHDLIFKRDTAFQSHNIDDLSKESEHDLLTLASVLNDKLKKLILVPYKFYNTEEEKFKHWAINPEIYDIINILYRCFSLPVIETVQVLSYGDEKIQFRTKKTHYYDIDRNQTHNPNNYFFQDEKQYVKIIQYIETYFLEHINIINSFSSLVQSIQLPKLFDLNFMNYDDNMEYFKLNSNNVTKRVIPIQYYPDLGEKRKVDFEVNVSAGATNASKLFEKLYSSLQNYNQLNSKDKSDIFYLELEEEDSSNIAMDLFYYDYFMYRQEQQRHILKYFNQIVQMPKKDFEKLFKVSSAAKIYSEIQDNAGTVEIDSDAIRKKIDKIKKTLQNNY